MRPLPGARRLLAHLSELGCPFAIATSGRMETAGPAVAMLDLPEATPIVTRDLVPHAKPDPDLFLEAARQLGVDVEHAVVVGDSVWDMLAAQRARTLAIGVLSGGYGTGRAGAGRRLPGL